MDIQFRLQLIQGYIRGLWKRSIAKVLCYFGHHDYEVDAVHDNCADLSCFYCEHPKRSYLPRTDYHD